MLQDHYAAVTGWIFEHGLQPALYALGLMDWGEDLYTWLDFAIFGLFGIAMVYVVCRPLEAWRPVEPRSGGAVVRTDMVYTFLSRLGILPLVAFVLLASLQSWWEGWLTEAGVMPPTLEELIPPLRDHPLLALGVYIVVLDLGEYWRHRAQHGFRWWWALHAIHHAQRQMTFWTDDRNHILDDILAALWFGALALVIGVPPGQFPIILLVLRLFESLSHANVRLSYGRIGERLLVSPRFHRLHHGELSAGATGRNYAVLLPVWDWIFGTADFDRSRFPPTGAPDAGPAMERGGWLRQQWAGFQRLALALVGRA